MDKSQAEGAIFFRIKNIFILETMYEDYERKTVHLASSNSSYCPSRTELAAALVETFDSHHPEFNFLRPLNRR